MEYYAGAGTIGLILAAKGVDVTCFESNQSCERAFNESRKRLSKGNITWTCASTDKALKAMQEKDVVIVDPPRKGLDKMTLEALASAKGGTKLVYLSCGWESCRKNLDYLIAQGWVFRGAEIYMFFPGSDHIETLQLLEKNH